MRSRLAVLGMLGAAAAFGFPNPSGDCGISSPAILPTAVAGSPVSYTLQTNGCSLPLYFVEVATGSLPPGLSIQPGTTTITGTPTTPGTYAFAIRLIDYWYGIPSKTFVWRVAAKTRIETAALASSVQGTVYSDQVRVSGGVPPHTFTVVEGALPSGLTLNSGTGAITGTTPAAGSTFRVRATDSTGNNFGEKPFTIAVLANRITTTANAPVGSVGTAYSFDVDSDLSGTGFFVALGSLPPGLSMNAAGLISGTPTTVGPYHFTVRCTLGTTSVWRSYYIPVNGAGSVTGAPRAAEQTFAYDHVFGVSGGVGPYTYAVTAGSLPSGVTLDSATGALYGEVPPPLIINFSEGSGGGSPPREAPAGSASFTVTATDSTGRTYTGAFNLQIFDYLSPVQGSAPDGAAGVAYTASVLGLSGATTDAKTFRQIDGDLPPGVTLNPSTGVVSGTPAFGGYFGGNFLATDTLGGSAFYDYVSFPIYGSFSIWKKSLPNALLNDGTYSQFITTADGKNPQTFAVTSGALPTGMTLGAATGTLSGPATAAGIYTFTVTATDAFSRTASQSYTMRVSAGAAIDQASLPAADTGVTYSTLLTMNGGFSTGNWSVSSGSLPPGLVQTANSIAGTPTTPGTYTFTITYSTPLTALPVYTDSRAFTINVSPALSITTTSPLPAGSNGVPYSQTVTATGGRAPYTFGIGGEASLPLGLHLNPTTGEISGTVMGPVDEFVPIRVSDADGRAFTKNLLFLFEAPVRVNPATLPNGTRTVAYSQSVTITGGSGPYALSASGTLPNGLNFTAASGLISGTPTVNGNFTFTITATDYYGRTGTRTYTVTITDPISITSPTNLVTGLVLSGYADLINTTGGAAQKNYSVTFGNVPPLLTLNETTGAVSNLPLLPGVYNFSVGVVDSDGRSATKAHQITIRSVFTIAPAILSDGTVGSAYSQALTTVGAAPPVTFSLSAGSLPPGLTLSPAGVLSGTPASAGTFNFHVVATDSGIGYGSQAITVTIVDPIPPLVLSPASMPIGRVGEPYSVPVSASGGVPPYTFALAQGGLPPGLLFNGTSVSGTPTAEGTYRFGINVTDSRERSTGTLYTVVIEPALLPLRVTPDSIPGAQVGQGYSTNFGATGGRAPYTFALSGSLPTGMSFNSGGMLSGTPSVGGTFGITVTVTDALQKTASRGYTLNVTGDLIITTQPPLPEGAVGTAYSTGFGASGGKPPYSWQISGTPPPGLAFDGASGGLSGTPVEAGTFGFTVQVTDTQRLTASRGFSITIYDRLRITNSPPDTLRPANQPYSFGFTTTGGKPPVTFALTGGNLPPGLGLGGNGTVSGTPTQGGSFSFTVEATDTLGNKAPGGGTIRIADPLTVTTTSLPNATIGVAYSASVGASGGVPPLGDWSISQGSLPAGLSFNAGGGISGTPTALGTASFTVRITDSAGGVATRGLSITVGVPPLPPVTITGAPPTLPPGQQSNVGLQIGQPFPAPISGRLIMDFTPAAVNNADDPAVQFSSGGRTVTFNIPAGQTGANFPVDPLRILTGTVAGTIRIRIEAEPGGNIEERIITVARSVPVITAGSVQQGAGSFTVQLDGYSNTRELSGATFRFNPVAGASLQTAETTLNVSQIFTAWYQSAASQPFGGQFRLVVPFTVQGTLNDVDTIVVTLTNSVGASQPFTIRLR